MKMLAFANRVRREILRDPLNLFFGLGFPILLLLLFSAIGKSVPEAPFSIEIMAPGVAVFSLSFVTLFSATLISRDRESAFLVRLYATPLKTRDFIFGYALWLFPISLLMGLICFLAAIPLGLQFTENTLLAVLFLLRSHGFRSRSASFSEASSALSRLAVSVGRCSPIFRHGFRARGSISP